LRIPRYKTLSGTIEWFYDFKLHLIANYKGWIVAAKITRENTHDTQTVSSMLVGSTDNLYADKGYHQKRVVN
jgi:IS5 family transposase